LHSEVTVTHSEKVLKWDKGRSAQLEVMAADSFQGGAIIAFVGFLLPWVLPAPDYGSVWWYGGWEMIFDVDKREFWVIALGVLYLGLLVITFLKTDAMTRLFVALGVFLSTALVVMLVVASVALKNPIEAIGIGLFVLIVGHTLMLFGAITGALMSMLSAVFFQAD